MNVCPLWTPPVPSSSSLPEVVLPSWASQGRATAPGHFRHSVRLRAVPRLSRQRNRRFLWSWAVLYLSFPPGGAGFAKTEGERGLFASLCRKQGCTPHRDAAHFPPSVIALRRCQLPREGAFWSSAFQPVHAFASREPRSLPLEGGGFALARRRREFVRKSCTPHWDAAHFIFQHTSFRIPNSEFPYITSVSIRKVSPCP